MNFVALQMLLGDRAKYLGLIFAVAFSTFLMSHQSSIFAGIMRRTTSQIMDVPDANLWVMDRKTQYFDEVKALTDDDLYRVRGVDANNNVSAYSNVDLATTILFTNDPLIAGVTVVKAQHFTELRSAVNAVRAPLASPRARAARASKNGRGHQILPSLIPSGGIMASARETPTLSRSHRAT